MSQVFQGAHYAGSDLNPSFEEGEPWQKVFGPIFVYLNSAPMGTPYSAMWENAKAQVSKNSINWLALFSLSFNVPIAIRIDILKHC